MRLIDVRQKNDLNLTKHKTDYLHNFLQEEKKRCCQTWQYFFFIGEITA